MKLESGRMIQNICFYGIGGVGGYFGGRMAKAFEEDDSHSVSFIARGQHLTEIRSKGLTLNIYGQQPMTCYPTYVSNDITEVPVPDLCFVSVKGYDLGDGIRELSKVIRQETIVVPLLNGVDIYERIRTVLKEGIVLPACVYVVAHIQQPGTVTVSGGGLVYYGADPVVPDFDPSELNNLFARAGIRSDWQSNPYPAIWTKYLFIASFGLVTAYSGATYGQVMQEPELLSLVKGIMEEIRKIAAKKGILLSPELLRTTLERGATLPADATTSYQRDVARGGPNEGELFGGTIIRMGSELGVATPVTEKVYPRLRV